MKEFKISTDLDAEALRKVATRSARSLGFQIVPAGKRSFCATRGNLALSILAGCFVPYCNFRISIREFDDGCDLVLIRNTPWWTGFIGVSLVNGRAEELMRDIRRESKRRARDDDDDPGYEEVDEDDGGRDNAREPDTQFRFGSDSDSRKRRPR